LRYLSIESSTMFREDARPGAVGIAQILQALEKNRTLDQLVIKQVTQALFGIRAAKNFDPVIESYGLKDRIQVI